MVNLYDCEMLARLKHEARLAEAERWRALDRAKDKAKRGGVRALAGTVLARLKATGRQTVRTRAA